MANSIVDSTTQCKIVEYYQIIYYYQNYTIDWEKPLIIVQYNLIQKTAFKLLVESLK